MKTKDGHHFCAGPENDTQQFVGQKNRVEKTSTPNFIG